MTALLLADEAPRILQPTLAGIFGVDGALFLQQVHYLRQASRHERGGRRWVYNTYSGWQRYFPFWGVGKIGHLIRDLAQTGVLLVAQLDRNSLNRTNWYSIDETCLATLVAAHRAAAGVSQAATEMETDDPPRSRETARCTPPVGALQADESARSKQRDSVQRIPYKESQKEAVEDMPTAPLRDREAASAPLPPPPPLMLSTELTAWSTPIVGQAAIAPATYPVSPTAPAAYRVVAAERPSATFATTPTVPTPPSEVPSEAAIGVHDPAEVLVAAAWKAYKQDLDTAAPPGLRACMARDIRAALAKGVAFTEVGLSYAVLEATKARGPRWPYLFRIWQAHPAGPPAHAQQGDSRYGPAPQTRAQTGSDRAAHTARAQELLSNLLGGPLPHAPGLIARAASPPAVYAV